MSDRCNFIINLNMTCGIYLIKNTVNGDIYVGQSKNIESRWKGLQSTLRTQHQSHSIFIMLAAKEYGANAFEFSVLKECEKHELAELEKRFIFLLRPTLNSYWCIHAPDGSYRFYLRSEVKEYQRAKRQRKKLAWEARRSRRTA